MPGIAKISPDTTPLSLLAPFLISGIGIGLAVAPVTSAVMATAPRDRVGNASGVLSTMRQVGSLLGIAVLGAVLQNRVTANITAGIQALQGIPDAIKQKIVARPRREARWACRPGRGRHAGGGRGDDEDDVPGLVHRRRGEHVRRRRGIVGSAVRRPLRAAPLRCAPPAEAASASKEKNPPSGESLLQSRVRCTREEERMAGTTQSVRPRVIVIPRPLEGHFYERLSERFAGRDDVDRRRRPPGRRAPPRPLGDGARTVQRTAPWRPP